MNNNIKMEEMIKECCVNSDYINPLCFSIILNKYTRLSFEDMVKDIDNTNINLTYANIALLANDKENRDKYNTLTNWLGAKKDQCRELIGIIEIIINNLSNHMIRDNKFLSNKFKELNIRIDDNGYIHYQDLAHILNITLNNIYDLNIIAECANGLNAYDKISFPTDENGNIIYPSKDLTSEFNNKKI